MSPLLCALVLCQGPGGPAFNSEISPTLTKGSVSVRGTQIAYSATSGHTLLRSDSGEIEARMFSVAYTKDGAEPGKRPVTFCFNGGPGSATLWLHMGGLGPKRAPMPDDGSLPKPPYSAVDNPDCWLDFTDLVFVDAPGTGYSRIAKPELGSKFFGVREDIRAFTEFVRSWLKQNNRWGSPLFVAGESYGGLRGSGLCNSLFDAGIAVSGFVSISGSNNFLTLDGMRANDATYISFLPTFAATAWYHKRLGGKFKDVDSVVRASQEFIDSTYAAALARGDSLPSADKDKVAGRLSELTGLTKQYWLDSNLRVPEFRFFRELLRDQGLSVGRYDGRLTSKEELKIGENPSTDASDIAVTSPFVSSINGYLQNDLKINTDLKYNTFGNVYPWKNPEGSYPETSSDLRSVLTLNPHFRVMFACGYYDMACPLQGTIFTVNHMGLDAESRSRVSYSYYPAGHMLYIEKGSRVKFHDDVAKFVADSLK